MARKYGIISLVVLCLAFLLAIITNLSLTEKGADIYTKKFHFLGVFDYEQVSSEAELDEEIEKSDLILVVRPTEEIVTYGYIVLQRVEIIKVLKGEKEASELMWISTTNGIYRGQNWGITNLMYSDYEYLVCLAELDGQYYDALYLGPIRLDGLQTCEPLDASKEYTYAELKEYKYFAEDVETLEKLYERETYILEIIGLGY